MVFSRIVAQIRRPVRPGALFAIVIEPGVMITEHLTGGLFDMYYSVEVRLRPSPERLQQSTKLLHPLHQQFPFNVVVHKPRANNSTLLSSFYAWLDRWKVCVTQHIQSGETTWQILPVWGCWGREEAAMLCLLLSQVRFLNCCKVNTSNSKRARGFFVYSEI